MSENENIRFPIFEPKGVEVDSGSLDFSPSSNASHQRQLDFSRKTTSESGYSDSMDVGNSPGLSKFFQEGGCKSVSSCYYQLDSPGSWSRMNLRDNRNIATNVWPRDIGVEHDKQGGDVKNKDNL